MPTSPASDPMLYDHLSKHPLAIGSPVTQSVLDELCQQWGAPATRQLLRNLYEKFQTDPILAGRCGTKNIQVLLQKLGS